MLFIFQALGRFTTPKTCLWVIRCTLKVGRLQNLMRYLNIQRKKKGRVFTSREQTCKTYRRSLRPSSKIWACDGRRKLPSFRALTHISSSNLSFFHKCDWSPIIFSTMYAFISTAASSTLTQWPFCTPKHRVWLL